MNIAQEFKRHGGATSGDVVKSIERSDPALSTVEARIDALSRRADRAKRGPVVPPKPPGPTPVPSPMRGKPAPEKQTAW